MFNYNTVISLHSCGKTTAEISTITGVAKNNIRAYFFRLNIRANEDNGTLTGYSMLPITEHKAYLLGVIYGDGSLGKENKKEITIAINDLDVLEGINRNVFDNKIKIGSRVLPSGKQSYILGIYNSHIWRELVDVFGLCNNKASTLKWPQLDNIMLPHFIRGLVDTDGSFFKDKTTKIPNLVFTYGSCSKEIVEKLKHTLMIYCGVNCAKISVYNSPKRTNPFYIIKWNNKKDAVVIGEWIYKNAVCKCDRKFQTWKGIKDIQITQTKDSWLI